MKDKFLKLFTKEMVIKLLMIFLVIQPLLDIYYLYKIPGLSNVFVFSPSTIIRFIYFGLLSVFAFFSIKEKTKYKWLIGFIITILIYAIFHHLNCISYNDNSFYKSNYSVFTELFYLCRMVFPIVLIYISYNFKLSDERFCKILYISAFIFSSIMIITNLLLVAIPSYDGAEALKINFLQWFTSDSDKLSYIYIASKGIFHMANQISATFVLILPLLIYFFNKKPSISKLIIILGLILSMFMLGTRVAAYSGIIITAVVLCLYIFFTLIKKENVFNKKTIIFNIIFLLFSIILYNVGPIGGRNFVVDIVPQDKQPIYEKKKIFKKLVEEKNKEKIIDFMEMNSEYFNVKKEFVTDIYPVSKNLEFWIDIYQLPNTKKQNDRQIQSYILKDVFNQDNILYNNIFGIGSSRIRNSKIYLEKDFIVHYYILGIVGMCIFILPYLLILLYSIFSTLFNFKDRLTFKNCILILSVGLTLICSYFSGNVLDELIVTIYLGVICGILLNDNHKCKKKKNVIINSKKIKLSIIIPVYNVEKYLPTCLDSVVNQTIDNFEVIIVNDGSPDNSQAIIDNYVKKYPNIIKSYKKKNGGLSDARNYGLKKAKGEYIAFLDSDDYIHINAYKKMYDKAIKGNFDVVVGNVNYVYDKKIVKCHSNIYYDINDVDEIKKKMIDIYPSVWNKIYKREVLGDLEFKKNVWFEDVEYLYRLIPNIKSIGSVDDYFIYYRQREGAITRTFDDRIFDHIDNWNGIIKFYKDNKIYNKYKKELEYCYVRYLYATLVNHSANYNNKPFLDKVYKLAQKNVKKTFPNYKKNTYFYLTGLKGLYLLIINKKIVNLLFKIKNRGGRS